MDTPHPTEQQQFAYDQSNLLVSLIKEDVFQMANHNELQALLEGPYKELTPEQVVTTASEKGLGVLGTMVSRGHGFIRQVQPEIIRTELAVAAGFEQAKIRAAFHRLPFEKQTAEARTALRNKLNKLDA